jgi:hypothetical protein
MFFPFTCVPFAPNTLPFDILHSTFVFITWRKMGIGGVEPIPSAIWAE